MPPGKWVTNWREQRLSIGREIDLRLERVRGGFGTPPDMDQLAKSVGSSPGVAVLPGECEGFGLDAPLEDVLCGSVVLPAVVAAPDPLGQMLPETVTVPPAEGIGRGIEETLGIDRTLTYRIHSIRVTGFRPASEVVEAQEREQQPRGDRGGFGTQLRSAAPWALAIAAVAFAFTGAGQALIESATGE